MNVTKSKLLRILSHETRLKVIEVLFDNEELSVSKIVEKTGLEQTRVSHQLSVMKKYKIAVSRVQGKHRIYSLNPKTMVEIMLLIDEHLLLFENTGDKNE